MSKEIKRYSMKIDRQNVLTIPIEENEGEWVKYKDVKEAIEPSGSLHPVIQSQVDWLFKNCNITLYNRDIDGKNNILVCPIEHNPHVNKDSRNLIESIMKKELDYE